MGEKALLINARLSYRCVARTIRIMNKWTEVRNKRKATSPIVNRDKESRTKLSEGKMADKEETQANLSLTRGTGNEMDISQGSGSASGFLSAQISRRSSTSSYFTVTQKSSKETEPKGLRGPSVMKSSFNSKPLTTKFSGGQSH